jgi:thioredoxin reductase (NADPH)
MMNNPETCWDIVVIGAGPAGLTAALYLARYRRKVLVVHDGNSRALRIPTTHNAPGFPEGIDGPLLIERMSRHAAAYGACTQKAEIIDIERSADSFRMRSSDGRVWESRAVVLASGILLNQVDLAEDVHDAALRAGVLRYCPICDGFEHTDQRIGVIGCDSDGAAEALFLRQYSPDITLMPLSHPALSEEQASELARAGIVVKTGALHALNPGPDGMEVHLEGEAAPLLFGVIYPALGSRPRAELAVRIGIELEAEGCVPVRSIRGRCVPGVFAAGDVVEGLDQISVAMGHGALAATSAHNWLREQDRQTLQAAC